MAIIKEYITNRDLVFPYMEIGGLLPLILTSASWRNHILATPTLWTDIFLGASVEELEMKVVTALHLSGTASIALYIDCPKLWSIMSSIILKERSRTSAIYIMGGRKKRGPGSIGR